MPFSNYTKHFEKGSWVGPGGGTKRFKMIDWSLIKGQSVLDLGCANGMLAIESKIQGAKKALGVDKGDWIPSVRQSVREVNLDVEFWQVDIESREFKRYCPVFDVVFFCAMLSHMRDGPEMLRWIDNHTKKLLYFVSNLGENNKAQRESVKKYTSFDAIKFIGQTGEEGLPNEGTRYMWSCRRTGKENQFESWRDAPVTFLPADEVKRVSSEVCEKLWLSERTLELKENIRINGLTSPLTCHKVGEHLYLPREGGKRCCILQALGYKDFPYKIVPPPPDPPPSW